jgi:hypothetical protein
MSKTLFEAFKNIWSDVTSKNLNLEIKNQIFSLY